MAHFRQETGTSVQKYTIHYQWLTVPCEHEALTFRPFFPAES